LQWAIYLTGPVYVVVLYQNFLYNKQVVEPMVYIFSGIHLASIALWNLWLSKAIEFKPKIYRLTNENLEVIGYKTNKSKKFKWEDSSQFYNLNDSPIPALKNNDRSTVVYILIKEGGEKQVNRNKSQYRVSLYCHEQNAQKVKDFLKDKIRKHEK